MKRLTTFFIAITLVMAAFSQEKPRLNHIALYVVDLKKSTEFY